MPVETTKTDALAGVVLGPPVKATDLGTLGSYRVIRAIGKGGMGIVFLGVDPKLRRKVALKVMLPKFLVKPQARDRFLKEARALAAVENDHVVPIYQVDEANGTPFIALKYLLGSTLEEYLRAGQKLSVDQMLHMIREVATGLQAAHEHNVVHRDIKPENIWLEAPEGRVKLIDFGLARLPAHNNQHTVDGTVLGTPAYMSPEQARGVEVDARSDLFSLGGVIYRLFAGRPPFQRDTPFNTVLALTQEPHVPLIVVAPQVPEALSRLVDSLLAKHPDQRPASARDVVKELKRIEARPRGAEPTAYTAIPIAENNANTWAALETEDPMVTSSNSSRIAPVREAKPIWPWLAGAIGVAVVVLVIALTTSGKTVAPPPESPRRGSSAKTTAQPTPPKPAVDPYTTLFNGRDLTGWVAFKDLTIERWKVVDGSLCANVESGSGEYLITELSYGSCELRFEYKLLVAGTDAGVVFFADDKNPGVEVQLTDDPNIKAFRVNAKQKHTAFFSLQAPFKNNAKGINEWNSVKITVRNNRVSVEENGSLVNDFDFSIYADKKSFRDRHPGLFDGRAPIALQCKSGAIDFRNIRIRDY